ncbi:MAG: flavodoxin family protein, partial [Promethearchaeota archaeon]
IKKMMNALLLNGNTTEDSEIDMLYYSIVEEIKRCDFNVESILLRDVKVTACQGCFDCWVKTPGECKIDDSGREIARKMVQSNLILHFTPITFGGYSSEIKKVIDRFIPTILPFFTKRAGEIHHKQRYEKRASIIVIGFLDKPDKVKESVFRELTYRNSLNMEGPYHEVLIYIKNGDQTEFLHQFKKILKKVGGKA